MQIMSNPFHTLNRFPAVEGQLLVGMLNSTIYNDAALKFRKHISVLWIDREEQRDRGSKESHSVDTKSCDINCYTLPASACLMQPVRRQECSALSAAVV